MDWRRSAFRLRTSTTARRRFGLTLAQGTARCCSWLRQRLIPIASCRIWCDTYSAFLRRVVGGRRVQRRGASVCCRAIVWPPAALGLGVALVAIAALLNPSCLAGPLWRRRCADADFELLLPGIEHFEASSSLGVLPPVSQPDDRRLCGYAVFALALGLAAPATGKNEDHRLAPLFSTPLALVAATFQYRATPFALVFALPGLATVLARFSDRRGLVWLTMVPILLSGVTFALLASLVEGQEHVASRATAFRTARSPAVEKPAMAVLRVSAAWPGGGLCGCGPGDPASLRRTAQLPDPITVTRRVFWTPMKIFAGAESADCPGSPWHRLCDDLPGFTGLGFLRRAKRTAGRVGAEPDSGLACAGRPKGAMSRSIVSGVDRSNRHIVDQPCLADLGRGQDTERSRSRVVMWPRVAASRMAT